MGNVHPLDILQGYRLGSRQATTELQRPDIPSIHINFKVLDLIATVQAKPGQAIILTGTAGDGKTYLAYKLIDALGLDRDQVVAAQALGGYNRDGIFTDLDLSADVLSVERVACLQTAMGTPGRLTLICVVYPQTVYTDLNGLWLLGTFGDENYRGHTSVGAGPE
jgi:hypothetical protein